MFGSGKRDRLFYGAFEDHAARLVEAAALLREIFEKIENAGDLAKRISDVEHAGDKITHATIANLHRTWITPLDRADIHGLITALDDVLDLTEAVSERVVLFEIDLVTQHALDLSQVLVHACEAVQRAIGLLPNLKQSKQILELCVEINRLENEGDQIYRRALADLYRTKSAGGEGARDKSSLHGDGAALAVLKWRDIYDNLEAATDRCEDVANILEGVVLEYA